MSTKKTLRFKMETQRADFWCWAAVSSSVSHFYNRRSDKDQCSIAEAVLNKQSCCPRPRGGQCDETSELPPALRFTRNFDRPTSNPISWDAVRDEILAERIVCARIGFGSNGHFVAISGIDDTDGTQMVFAEDPINGEQWMKYTTFRNNYFLESINIYGDWTDTFFTIANQSQ